MHFPFVGLLHPSLLSGEGGYYLTTLLSAVHVLKNFKESNEENVKNNLKSDVSVLKVCLFIIYFLYHYVVFIIHTVCQYVVYSRYRIHIVSVRVEGSGA